MIHDLSQKHQLEQQELKQPPPLPLTPCRPCRPGHCRKGDAISRGGTSLPKPVDKSPSKGVATTSTALWPHQIMVGKEFERV
ncbi:hypothetical protein SUGI_0399650 [Cryptomeria japonica]|nr:hypothetical protein SUGI_0399650 [Cryptomeria japonica]